MASTTVPKDWHNAYDSYPIALKALADSKKRKSAGEKLIELDNWYRNELPNVSNQQGFMSHEDVCRIMEWKLHRGEFRPKLQQLVQANSEENVTSITKNAFETLKTQNDIKNAMNQLTKLKGIGPATASALLAAFDQSGSAPFMSDEGLEATVGLAKGYTLNVYMEFVKQLQEKSKELNEAEGDSFWNPQRVEVALRAFHLAKKLNISLEKGTEETSVTEVEEIPEEEVPTKKRKAKEPSTRNKKKKKSASS